MKKAGNKKPQLVQQHQVNCLYYIQVTKVSMFNQLQLEIT